MNFPFFPFVFETEVQFLCRSNGCDTARVRFVECSKLAAEVESVSIRRAAPASSESRVNPFMDVLLSHTPPSLTPTLVEQLSDEVDNRLPLPYLNQQLDLPSSSVAVLSEPSGVRGFFGCLMSTLWSNSPGTSSSGLKRQRYYKGQDEYDGRIGDEGTKLTKRRRTLY